jgi:hypothetical protein
VLYEGVELADPETAQTLLRCRLLEVAVVQASSRHSVEQASSLPNSVERASSLQDAAVTGATQAPPTAGRPVITLVASQPELSAAAVGKTWQWLEAVLRRNLGRLEADVRFSAAELTLRAAQGSQTLTGVEGVFDNPSGQQTNLLVRFRLVGHQTPEPARLRIVRNRQVSPPATGIELYTGDGQLPCRLLAAGIDDLGSLGPRSRFRGYVWADETANGWEGELTGQLVELDLGGLVGDHFPHRMSGTGQATIQSAHFREGRLEELNATLVAGPGLVDRSLVDAAKDCLGLSSSRGRSRPPSGTFGADDEGPSRSRLPGEGSRSRLPGGTFGPGEQLAYEQLAVAVTLDAEGLRLRGQCAAGGPGTILSDGRGPLLVESRRQWHPVSALVETLVPSSAWQVPASRQTDWLLHHLPLPDAIVSPDAIPTAHLRLHDSWRR